MPAETPMDGFPCVSRAAWQKAAERELKGGSVAERLVSRSEDGIAIEPLYSGEQSLGDDPFGFPGAPPYGRGASALGNSSGWQICQRVAQPEQAVAAAEVRAEIDGGATALWLCWDRTARSGRDGDDAGLVEAAPLDGLLAASAEEVGQLLAGIDLKDTALLLDAGACAIPATALVVAAGVAAGMPASEVQGRGPKAGAGLGCDPLGALARDGELPAGLERCLGQLTDLAGWCAEKAPRWRAAVVSTVPHHDAGASAAQELGIALSTGLTYLRTLNQSGLSLEQASAQLLFRFAVGRDLFVEIAKLRAARLTWGRLVEACGGSAVAQRMALHVETSHRTKTARDPWVNMLRDTVETFAGAVGGAEWITTSPFDQLAGLPGPLGRRIARNTQTILQHEAHIHRVIDAAGGSGYVEALTRELASAAWEQFQRIEGAGGLIGALTAGELQRQIGEMAAQRKQKTAAKQRPITGVTEYPNANEQPLQRAARNVSALREERRTALAAHRARWAPEQAIAALRRASGASARRGALTAAAIECARAGATLGAIAQALAAGSAPFRVEALPPRRDAASFE